MVFLSDKEDTRPVRPAASVSTPKAYEYMMPGSSTKMLGKYPNLETVPCEGGTGTVVGGILATLSNHITGKSFSTMD
jgi:hypothetical protein